METKKKCIIDAETEFFDLLDSANRKLGLKTRTGFIRYACTKVAREILKEE